VHVCVCCVCVCYVCVCMMCFVLCVCVWRACVMSIVHVYVSGCNVYVCERTCAYLCVFMYVCVCVWVCGCVFARTRALARENVRTCAFKLIDMHTNDWFCMCACMNLGVCVHTSTHTQTHTFTHAHLHTNTQTPGVRWNMWQHMSFSTSTHSSNEGTDYIHTYIPISYVQITYIHIYPYHICIYKGRYGKYVCMCTYMHM